MKARILQSLFEALCALSTIAAALMITISVTAYAVEYFIYGLASAAVSCLMYAFSKKFDTHTQIKSYNHKKNGQIKL